ncbi:MAG: N-acetyltransferase [Planctomycetota bacterium]
MIRRATIRDVPTMARIINDAAEFGLMLPKSLASLYENVREFHVAADDGSGDVVGVCGLSVVWADLGEVVSLAVAPSHRGRGLGRSLAGACLEEARNLALRRVMTLTYEQRFFERMGFSVVDRQSLPLKVWADCVRCPKQKACDEIAMIRVFNDVPPPPPDAAAAEISDGLGLPQLRATDRTLK